jgi:hypothetical protein
MPAWRPSETWTVPSDSFVAIGTGDIGTTDVSAALRLGNGVVIAADDGSKTLRWIGASSQSTIGGPGDGPGEFRSIFYLAGTTLDSVFVWDGLSRRTSVFHDGRYVRALTLNAPADWVSPSIYGILGDGHLLVGPVPVPQDESPAGVHRPLVPVGIFTPSGDMAVELGRFPGTTVEYRPASTRGAVIRALIPLGASTVVAAGIDHVIVGDNARYELLVYDQAGKLIRIVRLPGAADPVTDRDLEQELQRRLDGAPPIEEVRAGIRATFMSTPVPDNKPYYDRLLVDGANHLWIRRGHSPEADEWDVVAPDGRWLGTVRTPGGLEVNQIGDDFVLGLRANADGVKAVRSYPLRRVPGS